MIEGDRAQKKNLLWDALAIFGLYNLCVARPLFELLAPNAEFFVFKRASRLEIFIFIVALSFLIPTFLVLIRFLISKISTNAGNLFQGLIIAILTLAFILPGLNRHHLILDNGMFFMLIICCALLGVGYILLNWLRLFYVYLAPAILVVPLLFVFSPRIYRILFHTTTEIPSVKIQSKTPLVFIIFDEFPLISLLDQNREIDKRYPTFLRLSKEWNWYRRATTVGELTESAVPGILTGCYPKKDALPVLRDYPENLFTLLKNSHKLEVFETLSLLNPGNILANEGEGYSARWRSLVSDLWIVYLQIVLPERYLSNLPPVAQSWGDFSANAARVIKNQRSYSQDRVMLLKSFFNAAKPSKEPVVYFLHVMLPHSPWHLLPSGKDYQSRTYEGLMLGGEKWKNDEAAIQRAYQRHLLQVGYIDRWLGTLLHRLEETDFYDKSVIVVVADHGISFEPGEAQRVISKENAEEIMFVPLFIKGPYQKNGKTLDWNVETIDVLPTVAELMNFKIPWKVDGVSVATQPPSSDRPRLICGRLCQTQYKFEPTLPIDNVLLQRKVKWFGDSVDEGLNHFAPCRELIGKAIPASTQTADNITITIRNKDLFTNINPNLDIIPTFVAGVINSKATLPRKITIGISMNGIFAATTTSSPSRANSHSFDALVPESALKRGNNHLQIYQLPSCDAAPLLIREGN
jgi:hypothetical protein